MRFIWHCRSGKGDLPKSQPTHEMVQTIEATIPGSWILLHRDLQARPGPNLVAQKGLVVRKGPYCATFAAKASAGWRSSTTRRTFPAAITDYKLHGAWSRSQSDIAYFPVHRNGSVAGAEPVSATRLLADALGWHVPCGLAPTRAGWQAGRLELFTRTVCLSGEQRLLTRMDPRRDSASYR